MSKTTVATIVCASLIVLTVAVFILTGFSQGLFSPAEKLDAKINEGLGGVNVSAAFPDSGKLTFLKGELTEDGSNVNVYTDENENEYRFDSHNNLVGYEFTGGIPGRFENGASRISEKEAREMGRGYAERLFTTEVREFTDETLQYKRDSAEYEFTLTRRLGENGFVQGPFCTIDMFPKDGMLLSASLSSLYILEGFDESLLDGVTEAKVEETALKQAAEKFREGNNFEVRNIALKMKNGKYCLEVSVEYSQGGGKMLDKIYYGL